MEGPNYKLGLQPYVSAIRQAKQFPGLPAEFEVFGKKDANMMILLWEVGGGTIWGG